MSEQAPTRAPKIPARSMGRKLLLVCLLALVMTIPALFVFALLGDRSQRAQEVSAEVSQLVGGAQTFMGPVLAIPYTAPGTAAPPPPPPPPGGTTTSMAAPAAQVPVAVSGVHVVFPDTGRATVATTSEVRRRSLFEVPVYDANLTLDARFGLPAVLENLPRGAVLDWERAEFLVGATDPRGAKSEIVLTAPNLRVQLEPASSVTEQALFVSANRHRAATVDGPAMRFFGASAAGLARPGSSFDVATRLRFTGAERIAVLPYGRTSTVTVTGDWPDPSFNGGFLPTDQRVSDEGFRASWSVPFIARGVADSGSPELISRLGQSDLGVSFVEPANAYQSVSRSLKYAVLFIGLVFLTFFVFEVTTGRRVHPAQYVLVGLAQIIFYLLLLAIAEHLGFDLGFLIAAIATVLLISAYAQWTFDSRRQGIRALIVFALLYGGIYVLMRLEDYALLVGAIASFLAIAAVMWFTRRIDWYGVTEAPPAGPRADDAAFRSVPAG